MLIDVALHFGLEMGGALSFACLWRGCKDSNHCHGRVIKWMAAHRWISQSIVALVMAYVTVRLVG